MSQSIGFVGNIADPDGASSIARRSPMKELPEVMNMEIMKRLMTAEDRKETVIEDDEPDPSDIGDWQYKDLLESQYMRQLEDKRKE